MPGCLHVVKMASMCECSPGGAFAGGASVQLLVQVCSCFGPCNGRKQRTQQVQEHSATILGVGVRSKVNPLLPELLQKLRASARQLHPDPLHAVAQLGGHGLNDGNGAVFVQVDLQDGRKEVQGVYTGAALERRMPRLKNWQRPTHLLHTPHLQVLQEAGVGHARRGNASGIVGLGSRGRQQGRCGGQSPARPGVWDHAWVSVTQPQQHITVHALHQALRALTFAETPCGPALVRPQWASVARKGLCMRFRPCDAPCDAG